MERAISVAISLTRFCQLTLEGIWIDLQLWRIDSQLLWLTRRSDKPSSESGDQPPSDPLRDGSQKHC